LNITNEVFDKKWEQIRAQSNTWWSLFSEDDLDKVAKAPVKRDKYVVMLRMKYGYTHERAKEEIHKRIAELEANPPSNEAMQDSLDRQNSAKIPKTRKRRIKAPKTLSNDNVSFE
jgi:hypothetical protein